MENTTRYYNYKIYLKKKLQMYVECKQVNQNIQLSVRTQYFTHSNFSSYSENGPCSTTMEWELHCFPILSKGGGYQQCDLG